MPLCSFEIGPTCNKPFTTVTWLTEIHKIAKKTMAMFYLRKPSLQSKPEHPELCLAKHSHKKHELIPWLA